MYSNVKEYEAKGKFPETIDTVAQATEVNQTQAVNVNENELTIQTKPDLAPLDKKTEIIVEKASERHYDGKRFWLTLKYSHRTTGIYFYYNERLPRFLRLLISYISMFFTLLLSGIFYFEYGNTNDVNGYIFIHAFGFSIVWTIFDWVLYIVITFMFLLKPNPEEEKAQPVKINEGICIA